MSEDLTFADVVDFLADHKGKKVYIEIGTRDLEAERSGDAFVLKLHNLTFGEVEDAYDEIRERKAPMVMLGNGEDGSRMFINPRQVTKIEGDPHRGLKVWLDDAFYIALAG